MERIMEAMNKKRIKLDKEIVERQTERLREIMKECTDARRFEECNNMIDKEIEFLILYYTSSIRKGGDELGFVL